MSIAAGTVRVLACDDHPVVRAGLRALIDSEHDMSAVGEAVDEFTLPAAIRRFEPDVVLLDYQLQGTNGVELCRQIKSAATPPGVVIYSAFVAASMAVSARIAGADALVDKGVPPRELVRTIRRLAAGEAAVPEVTPESMAVAADLVRADDLPILGMLAHRAAPAEIAATLHISADELDRRTERILEVLA